MIYQRHMPREELVAAQLEMLMQSGRRSTISLHFVGIVATVAMFWPYLPLTVTLLWAAGFLALLLARSLLMSNALVEKRYRTHSLRVYWQLILGAALTGVVWSSAYILSTRYVPVTMQYAFLLLIVMITAFSLGFSVVVREYFVIYMFASLWPIGWWCLIHYWDQPYNFVIGVALMSFCALLIYVCDQTYQPLRHMIALTWEREHIARELSDLTISLRDRNRHLTNARRQLTDLANIDELTGLGNRRLVNNVLREELNRARRTDTEISLIMLDVDHFKAYNDHYGHPAGDAVLQQLADVMQRATSRAGEVVARYGGEEFLIILPGASAPAALRTADRLRQMIEKEAIPHERSPVSPYITISQGVVTADAETEPDDLIKLADQALYSAKDAGRDAIALE
ncbi:MAG: diguanylate cyclase [Halioglobus sp.]|nr:diguanylate cyclase [Halioglobus sp.]